MKKEPEYLRYDAIREVCDCVMVDGPHVHLDEPLYPSDTEPDGYCLKRPDGTLNVEYCFESREEAEHELGLESLHLGHGYAVVPVRVVECEEVEE